MLCNFANETLNCVTEQTVLEGLEAARELDQQMESWGTKERFEDEIRRNYPMFGVPVFNKSIFLVATCESDSTPLTLFPSCVKEEQIVSVLNQKST